MEVSVGGEHLMVRLLNKASSKMSSLLDQLNYTFNLPKISVQSTEQTLNLILNDSIKVVRFGDGEFDLIEGKSITYQQGSPQLSKQLRDVLFSENEKLLVCVPDFFENISRYTDSSIKFWKHDIRKRERLYKEIANTTRVFGSAQISRPYINLKDKSISKRYFKKLKQIWENKDILIVEGETSRSGVGNDLFDNAKSIKRIICPSKNAYSKLREIESKIQYFKENRLILLMLGPTAKIAIADLVNIKNQMIDIGHLDSEYEWFLRGDLIKTKIPNKHTAEFNLDNNIVFNKDPEYERQIVAKIL